MAGNEAANDSGSYHCVRIQRKFVNKLTVFQQAYCVVILCFRRQHSGCSDLEFQAIVRVLQRLPPQIMNTVHRCVKVQSAWKTRPTPSLTEPEVLHILS